MHLGAGGRGWGCRELLALPWAGACPRGSGSPLCWDKPPPSVGVEELHCHPDNCTDPFISGNLISNSSPTLMARKA